MKIKTKILIFILSINIFNYSSAENIIENKNVSQNIQIENIDYQTKLKIYNEIKAEKVWWLQSIIISILLWLLYWYAYYSTISKVKNKFMPIDTKSFTIFWLTSWWMVLVNWFIPWSLVYFESFCLALFAVYLHLQNIKNKKTYQK